MEASPDIALSVAELGVMKRSDLSCGCWASWGSFTSQCRVLGQQKKAYCDELVDLVHIWPRPFQVLKDAMYAFLEVERTKVEALDTPLLTKSLDHLDGILDSVVLDQPIIVLEI